MKKKLNLRDFAILQLVVLIYTSSTVISKIAAQSAESGKGWTFLLLYGAEIGVLGIYALCWQQVIKRVELSVAYANRAASGSSSVVIPTANVPTAVPDPYPDEEAGQWDGDASSCADPYENALD